MKHSRFRMYRREFLGTTARLGAGLGASAVAGNLLSAPAAVAGRTGADSKTRPKATADTCIFVWLAGGMCHLDTFDPKLKGNGQEIAGSYYNPIETNVPGLQVCEHLPRIAERMDRFAFVRSLNHQFTEHTQAVNFVHTGRVASGTIVYPSIGSIVSHQLGGFDPKAPAYVVVGNPMQPRGPGFLGGKSNFVYLTDTEAGPSGLRLPDGVSVQQYEEWTRTLKTFSEPYLKKHAGTPIIQAYGSVMDRGFEMMSPKFQNAFSVKDEPAELRESYGKEFGQRLLLSRRLVESGIRFVECSFNLHFINGYGWDAHAFAQKRVHLLIRQLDRGLSALVEDLERRRLLDRTLVVVATEFGRPPEFDGQGGRGHQSAAYSVVLFGGGVRGGQAIGATDELGREIVERPVSIPDLHATIHRALGIDPEEPLMTPGGRPVPITDFGQPVEELFS